MSDALASDDAAEDVDENAFDVRVLEQNRNPAATVSFVAPPPTSRKLAGSLPASLITSIVAIARPAPFTMQPMLPSNLT